MRRYRTNGTISAISFLKTTGLACVGLTLLGTGSVFAGNGTAINGPDLKGISIPSAIGRGISEAQINDALQTCGAMALRPLYQLVDRGTTLPTFLTGSSDTRLGSDGKRHQIGTITLVAQSVDPAGEEGTTGSCTVSMKPISAASPGRVRLSIQGCPSGNGDYYSDSPVPYLEYDLGLANVTYDEWGNVSSGKPMVENLHLVPNVASLGTQLHFINFDTRQVIGFKLNPREIAACLESEVVKN